MSDRKKSLPPLNWLRAFESAARSLSFTAAATELNMTHSAVSQQIKNLEHHLGRALFIRKTRSIELTDTGRAYLPVVQNSFEVLTAGTNMITGGDRGKILSIQCNLAFSVFWLSPRLPGLYDRHPWLALDITTSTWDTDLQTAGVEIRFGLNFDKHPNAIRLNKDRAFPVCTPQLAEKLEHWSEAHLFDCSGVLANWENWIKHKGETLPGNKLVNLATTYCVSINAALSNAGLAMGHEMLTERLITQGKLVRPFPDTIPMEEAYYLIEPPEQARTPASDAFVEWLKNELVNRS